MIARATPAKTGRWLYVLPLYLGLLYARIVASDVVPRHGVPRQLAVQVGCPQRPTPAASEGGIMKQSLETLRDELRDETRTRDLIEAFTIRRWQMMKPATPPDRFVEFVTRTHQGNAANIFRTAESPIELLFLNSLNIHAIISGTLMRFVRIGVEFTEFRTKESSFLSKASECANFYKSLPDDARPLTFREFLEAWVSDEQGDWKLSAKDADHLANVSLVELDFGMSHTFEAVLQPTLQISKQIRPDLVVWVPTAIDQKPVVVECDGFDYHSSRDQFASDRKRDRELSDAGFEVRRYSGTEIHNDPVGAAGELMVYLVDHRRHGEAQKNWFDRKTKGKPPRPEVVESWRARKAALQ